MNTDTEDIQLQGEVKGSVIDKGATAKSAADTGDAKAASQGNAAPADTGTPAPADAAPATAPSDSSAPPPAEEAPK